MAAYVALDPLSRRVLAEARSIAGSHSTVLIRGESGSGKDSLATLLHYLGAQAKRPLVRIDCAGLPPALLECELFGWGERPGGIFHAQGIGTIVLDEIAALTMPMQARLLRLIDERTFEGGGRMSASAVRIIALSNVDLERAVARRSFRQDLYYRLNVIPMLAPALRERPGDIGPLAERFVTQLAEMHRKPRLNFGPGVLEALQRYSYPGNVRELRSLLERAVVGCTPPEIALADLPPQVRAGAGGRKMSSLVELERAHIADVLAAQGGKKSAAAQVLGISRKTLLEKRKRYGLE